MKLVTKRKFFLSSPLTVISRLHCAQVRYGEGVVCQGKGRCVATGPGRTSAGRPQRKSNSCGGSRVRCWGQGKCFRCSRTLGLQTFDEQRPVVWTPLSLVKLTKVRSLFSLFSQVTFTQPMVPARISPNFTWRYAHCCVSMVLNIRLLSLQENCSPERLKQAEQAENSDSFFLVEDDDDDDVRPLYEDDDPSAEEVREKEKRTKITAANKRANWKFLVSHEMLPFSRFQAFGNFFFLITKSNTCELPQLWQMAQPDAMIFHSTLNPLKLFTIRLQNPRTLLFQCSLENDPSLFSFSFFCVGLFLLDKK